MYGQSYVNRILILDCAKGGVATAWMLHEMKARRMLPLAIVLNRANPIMAQGAALAGICLLAGFDSDITKDVSSGALVEIDPAAGVLRMADEVVNTAPVAASLPAGYRAVHGP
ncbi:aconitase X swivel domain-containing protein [Hydrogenophaga sp. ANAO-22]|uniref:aconitase X swivel domain-containing protein n=1 Tax=Hydrogenophaga sp. ANAO-22 TaxID=3166645 RepID=UPI0036D2C55B